jgi:hypothetical protein
MNEQEQVSAEQPDEAEPEASLIEQRLNLLCLLTRSGAGLMPMKRDVVNALSECALALLYYREQCSGYEPSLSVFQRKCDEALKRLETV